MSKYEAISRNAGFIQYELLCVFAVEKILALCILYTSFCRALACASFTTVLPSCRASMVYIASRLCG